MSQETILQTPSSNSSQSHSTKDVEEVQVVKKVELNQEIKSENITVETNQPVKNKEVKRK